jgi:hypothetical protein
MSCIKHYRYVISESREIPRLGSQYQHVEVGVRIWGVSNLKAGPGAGAIFGVPKLRGVNEAHADEIVHN